MVVERKPLSLPPPVIFNPQPIHTTLDNAHTVRGIPLPPTPPPPPYDPLAPLPGEESGTKEIADPVDSTDPGSDGSGGDISETTGSTKKTSSIPGTAPWRDRLLKKIGGDATGKRSPMYDFVYSDRDTPENEINEFYTHQDKGFILEGCDLFHGSFEGEWKTADFLTRSNYISMLLERLEFQDPEERYIAARKLLYIAQGAFGETTTQQEQMHCIQSYNILLYELGAFEYCYGALKVVSSTLDAIAKAPDPALGPIDRQGLMELANNETSVYLSLMHHMVDANAKDERIAADLNDTNVPVAVYLFGLVAQLAEGNRKQYPVKKLLLLLYNVLLISIGDTKRLKELKNASRTLHGLPPIQYDKLFLKSSPQDYHNFHLLAAAKYPAYVTPNADLVSPAGVKLAEPLPSNIKRQLQQTPVIQPFTDLDSMLPRAFAESVELYRKYNYISLSSLQIAQESERYDREQAKKSAEGASSEDKKDVNTDMMEEETMSHFGSERRRDLQAMGVEDKAASRKLKKKDLADLKRIETLYRHLLPNLPTYIGMLIRLLYYVNLGANTTGKPEGENGVAGKENTNGGAGLESPFGALPDSPAQRQEYLNKLSLSTHKEVVTKAVSGILLLLLKTAKCHHGLKFENLTQLLVDNNCAILILKMLSTWLQNSSAPTPTQEAPDSASWPEGNTPTSPTNPGVSTGMAAAWLTSRVEPNELKFLHFCRDVSYMDQDENYGIDSGKGASSSAVDTTTEAPADTRVKSCFRNFFTAISLLRILQKLTKNKTHRVLALVQWKASAVLKRVMKVNHVGLQLYALKLLKKQIPFLGKKWRSSNMKAITAIFMHLRPVLRDDYLAGDVDVDVDEALTQEQRLRVLTGTYHDYHYGDILNTNAAVPSDEASEAESHTDELDRILSLSRRNSSGSTSDDTCGILASTRRKTDYHDRLELDVNFMENYEEWLRHEVYDAEGFDQRTTSHWGSSDDSTDLLTSSMTPRPSHIGYPRSLFSATQRFSKDILNHDYDDTEVSWGDDEPLSPFVTSKGWDELDLMPEENEYHGAPVAPEDFDELPTWYWKGDDEHHSEDIADSALTDAKSDTSHGSSGSDSGVGSWSNSSAEGSDSAEDLYQDTSDGFVDSFAHQSMVPQAYPDEAPAQDDH
ncbi:hypothetical protein DFS34DRAFT_600849 [Phlyctochytrium arcticum]|nr:hypothetical protein DFS34DRAFT_600849 [Phlyctochytrium arcticum]